MKSDENIIEMLPGDLRRIAKVAGLEAAVRIARSFRGTFLYVPGLDDMMRRARDEIIRKEFDGGINIKALARRYGLTERRVRMILNSPSEEELPIELLNLLTGGK